MLLGNDLRIMSPKTLSIINNPAIIAISQDPRGRPVHRIFRNATVAKDQFGIGETHVWSGPLANGDQVVIFLNAANEGVDMEASLEEIFVSEGVGGTAPQVAQEWQIHDLWANRMSDSNSEAVLKATSAQERSEIFTKLNWYNSTQTPYAKGLEENDSRLFGAKVGTVSPHGIIQTHVERHSAKVFRLRSGIGKHGRKSLLKQELQASLQCITRQWLIDFGVW